MPAQRRATLPSEDDTFDVGIDQGSESALGEAFFLVYRDARGAESRRRVTVHRIVMHGGTVMVRAYCHERRAARSFRADRIVELVDMASGEVLDTPKEIGERLRTMAEPAADRDAATAVAVEARRHGLVALTFLARCDGHEHTAERAVILRYLTVAAPEPGLDHVAAGAVLDRLYPDEYSYLIALDELAQRPEDLVELARYALDVVEADGAIAPEEAEFMLELRDLLVEIRATESA